MRIAVTINEKGEFNTNFSIPGRFKLYACENSRIMECYTVSYDGKNKGDLADFFISCGIDALMCDQIDNKTDIALSSSGILIYKNNTGKCDRAVMDFISGNGH